MAMSGRELADQREIDLEVREARVREREHAADERTAQDTERAVRDADRWRAWAVEVDLRDQAAAERDKAADQREQAAVERDRAADLRDRAADQREIDHEVGASGWAGLASGAGRGAPSAGR